MTDLGHSVTHEVAYDLLQEHLDTMLALLDRPLPRTELLQRVGSEAVLQRLQKYGLVTDDAGTCRAAASSLHQLRQEGMVSFLERYILPSLAASASDDGATSLINLPLALATADVPKLDTAIRGMLHDLVDISEQPTTSVTYRLSVLVIGTSRIIPEALSPSDAALQHLREASLQRTVAAESKLAKLFQFDALADATRYLASEDRLARFVGDLQAQTTTIERARYHLTLASHWRCASADVAGTVRGTC